MRRLLTTLGVALMVACGGNDAVPDTGAPDASPEPGGVVERVDLGATWSCTNPGTCTQDYEAFIALAAAHARPVPEGSVAAKLAAIDAGEVASVPGPLSPEALREVVVDGLNVGFLLDGLDDRLLTVTTIGKTEGTDAWEHHLLLEDPWVGTFEALLLVPKGEGPFPAVVALHGHDDDARVYRDEYHGAGYPGRGYAIVMPTFRAMKGGIDALAEHEISVRLLDQGFTLIGLRAYEALLCLKVLRHLPSIDPDRIGLIGHSGGSSTGNLVVRLGAGFAAYVSDFAVDYAEWLAALAIVHCETVPDLYPHAALINDFATSGRPVLSVPYGYTDGMEPIFSFLGEHLGAGP
ncbi:MAG: hypothetical protein FJ087_19175 [Deltaproteobacteria bacterium]|nr:hypothetical protein [Deltaproteobacteria bacterium]